MEVLVNIYSHVKINPTNTHTITDSTLRKLWNIIIQETTLTSNDLNRLIIPRHNHQFEFRPFRSHGVRVHFDRSYVKCSMFNSKCFSSVLQCLAPELYTQDQVIIYSLIVQSFCSIYLIRIFRNKFHQINQFQDPGIYQYSIASLSLHIVNTQNIIVTHDMLIAINAEVTAIITRHLDSTPASVISYINHMTDPVCEKHNQRMINENKSYLNL